MHRQALIGLLDDYQARWPAEASSVERVRALLRARSDCFERSCMPGHVTASSWIVSHDHRRCLLTHHKKLDRWLQLGGHADGDPDVQRVAMREAVEESGLRKLSWLHPPGAPPVPIDIDVHRIPARSGEPAHDHHDIRFVLVAEPGQRLRISDESNDLRWFAPQEYAGLDTDESLDRLARKAQALLAALPPRVVTR